MDLVQATASEAVLDCLAGEAERQELGSREQTMLSLSQCMNTPKRNSLLFTCHNR